MDFATVNVADDYVDAAMAIIGEYEKKSVQENKVSKKNKKVFASSFITLAVLVLVILLLAIIYGY